MGEAEVDGWKRRVVKLVTEVEELVVVMVMVMVKKKMMLMMMMIMVNLVTKVEEGEGGKVLGPLASKLVQDFHTGLEIQVHTNILVCAICINSFCPRTGTSQ